MTYIKQKKHAAFPAKLASSVGFGAVLLSSTLSPLVLADNAALEEVVIEGTSVKDDGSMTSLKFTQPIAKTPQTIQIINKDLIKDQRATTLTEALQNTAGVGTFYAGENGNSSTGDAVFMRGFDASGSIFVDGVRDQGSVSRDTFNTEQVEVIKGPNGSNYGRSAPGGSINMVSKKAHLGNDANVNMSAGTADQKRMTVDANYQLSDSIAFRLNAVAQDSGVPGRDRVNNKRWGVAPTIAFGLGTDLRVHVNLLHMKQDNTPDGFVPTIGLPHYNPPVSSQTGFDISGAPRVDSENYYGTNNDFDHAQIDRVSVRVEKDLKNGLLHNVTRFSRIEHSYQLSAFMFSIGGSADSIHSNGQPNNPAAWTMRLLPNFDDKTNKIITNQTGVLQEITTGNLTQSLSYGVELIQEQVNDRGISSPLDGTGNALSYEISLYNPSYRAPNQYSGVKTGAYDKGTMNTAALYFFDTLTIAEDWKITAGLRLDHYKLKTEGVATTCAGRGQPACTGGVYTLGAKTTDKDSGTLFSWQLGAMYQITEQGNIYVDYAVASQPPGGDTLTLSTRASSADKAGLDPRKTKTAEIGTKWNLADERLLLTAAIYQTRVGDQVEADATAPGGYSQSGEKRVEGLELMAVGRITDAWDLTVSYSKMKAEIKKGATVTSDGSTDLAYTPEDSASIWTSYRMPFGLKIGAGVRYVGDMKKGRDGAKGTPEKIDSYWVANAMASYDVTDKLNLQMNVYNLTDEEYVASINKSGYRYTPAIPRSLVLSANLKF